jgi:hypothetical protein
MDIQCQSANANGCTKLQVSSKSASSEQNQRKQCNVKSHQNFSRLELHVSGQTYSAVESGN